MSLPTDINLIHMYYPVGNTPAVCLTRHLPPEIDARMLLLGCGDLRNVLFTCYTDGAPNRALDITFCDYEPGIIARNILLVSLTLDDVPSPTIWSLYYYFRVTPRTLQIIRSHAKKLADLASSQETWRAGPLGGLVDFSSSTTLPRLESIWSRWADESESAQCEKQKRLDGLVKTAISNGKYDFGGLAVSCMLPCVAADALPRLMAGHDGYWGSGGTTDNATNKSAEKKKETCVNPTFVAGDGCTFAHYATDAVIGFHLSRAVAPLVKGSPLYNSTTTLAETASSEFAAWIDEFRARIKRRRPALKFHFVFADALAMCHALAARNAPPVDHRLAPFVDHWHFDTLVWSDSSAIPRSFNVIDTSNLMDHLGGLNLLVAASPLLERSATAVLYTEMLLPESGSGPAVVNKAISGDLATTALLLGLFPAEHWTNATVSSAAELEIFVKLMEEGTKRFNGNRAQSQLRMTWRCAPRGSSDDNGSMSECARFRMAANDVSDILFATYCKLFEYENPMKMLGKLSLDAAIEMLPRSFPRAAWVLYMARVKKAVDTDWAMVTETLDRQLQQDTTSPLTPNYYQELQLYMYLHDMHLTDILSTPPARVMKSTGYDVSVALSGLASMPSVVCITLQVPRSKVAALTTKDRDTVGTPAIEGAVESNQSVFVPGGWQNLHAVTQAGFGKVKTSGAGAVVTDGEISVVEDPAGWSGNSPLVVSFLTPTWTLLRDPKSVRVRLSLITSPQTSLSFAKSLGPMLTVYSTTLAADKNLFISEGWPRTAAAGPGAAAPETRPAVPLSSTVPELTCIITAKAKASAKHGTGAVGTLIIRVEIGPGRYRTALQKQAAVRVDALSAVQVNATIGDDSKLDVAFTFPSPVDTTNLKTRIARKSSYLEIEAPVATADNWTQHPEFMFPVSLLLPDDPKQPPLPVPLHIPRCDLPKLPVVNCAGATETEFKWLNMHVTNMFSAKENVVKQNQSTPQPDGGMPRFHLKDSLFSLFHHFSGIQGGRAHLFGLSNPSEGGILILIFVSALRLDLGAQSVVLDAAVIPLRSRLIPALRPVLAELGGANPKYALCQVKVLEDEMRLWKAALPAFVERCRAWSHKATCEYRRASGGGKVPVSMEFGERLLCSCGEGVFPADFEGDAGRFPSWATAKRFATRAAIPLVFSVATVEKLVAESLLANLMSVKCSVE